MSALEELKEGASVRGILPNQNVTVIATKWHGDSVITLTFRDANGRPIERLLYRHDESSIEVVTTGRAWSFDADGGLPRKRSPATPSLSPGGRSRGWRVGTVRTKVDPNK
jgi:hypothetical protein